MDLQFDIASNQIDGARDYQEDAFMVSYLGTSRGDGESVLAIMADGMGGHAAGNVASNMAVTAFNKMFTSLYGQKTIPEALDASLKNANDQIGDSVRETPALHGMGCTMVTAFLKQSDLWWVSVGDSHLYLIRDKSLTKKNADHSYGAYLDMMREQGMEVEEQPGMSRNMLMSAMTGDDIGMIDVPEVATSLRPGDRIIIASDGLDTIDDITILKASDWANTATDCVRALLTAVEEVDKPHQDNATVLVIDVLESEKAAPPKSEQAPQLSASLRRSPHAQERKSSSALPWIIILFLLLAGGGGIWAWMNGLLDDLIASVKPVLVEMPTAATPVEPQQVPKPELVVEPELVAPSVTTTTRSIKDKLKTGGTAPEMMRIPAGEFRMGGPSMAVSQDERPRHVVALGSFYMSKYEVTFTEYDRYAKAKGKSVPDSKGWNRNSHPLVNVSWNDALAYAKWLSRQTGKKYRLPTEAEWEYAARAGSFTAYWWGNKSGEDNAHCEFCKSGFQLRKPAKIGAFKANDFGLHDTSGNVSEWAQDCYHPNYTDAPLDGSAWEAGEDGDCSVRVVRGGSYSNAPSKLRNASREKLPVQKIFDHVGIRLVRDL
ncbi:MAG: SUMF1/EgtB/PvdO family nonheme iron enzyme [Gammaproteobacteria bacterium]|nr:SUMF1/EgtB/PvdO family nonheme iron enzyme [Gammaproteobacteria bacterium]